MEAPVDQPANHSGHQEQPQENVRPHQQVQFKYAPQIINDNENVDEDQKETELASKFLLDSAVTPCHIQDPIKGTNRTRYPVNVTNCNGELRVTQMAHVKINTPAGPVRASTLVQERLPANLVTPIPVIAQKGSILLTTQNESVLPPNHAATREALRVGKKVATVNEGVHRLESPTIPNNKREVVSLGTTPTPEFTPKLKP